MYSFGTHRESSVYQVEVAKSIAGMSTFGCVFGVEAIFVENY
jgi:hypothetical protein